MSDPVTRTLTVTNSNGLHLVPCSLIARTANGFACRVQIIRDKKVADAKNIFDLMGLGAACGTELLLSAEGDSAADSIAALTTLFESGLELAAKRGAE